MMLKSSEERKRATKQNSDKIAGLEFHQEEIDLFNVQYNTK